LRKKYFLFFPFSHLASAEKFAILYCSKGQQKKHYYIWGGKMTLTQKAKLVLLVVSTGIMIWFAILAIQFGNKLSDQTEKMFADSIRVLQEK
jgi:hypothetical protein